MRWKKYWESRMKMKRDKIVIGSRESKLAVLQSEMVRDYIKEKNPDLECGNPHYENYRGYHSGPYPG